MMDTVYNNRMINWFAWKYLCELKDSGGMRFKNLKAFNLSMVDKK